MLEFKVCKLVHQLKVVVLEPHVLSYVHELYLAFNQSPFGPLSQLSPGLGWRPLHLMKERKVEPLVEKVADAQLFFYGL